MLTLKLAAPLALVLAIWGAAQGPLEALALLGGAGLPVIYALGKLRKAWRKVDAYIARQEKERRQNAQVRDAVLGTPTSMSMDERFRQLLDRQDSQDEQLKQVAAELNGKPNGIRDQLSEIREHIGLIAEADKSRIKDAIAGDERAPVDRRAT